MRRVLYLGSSVSGKRLSVADGAAGAAVSRVEAVELRRAAR